MANNVINLNSYRKASIKPCIKLEQDNCVDAIRDALTAINADVVVDDDDSLVATYDGHYRQLKAAIQICHFLAHYFRFERFDRPIDPPRKLARAFVEIALRDHWFKSEHRGPCPVCEKR
jgi:hypothetical protein